MNNYDKILVFDKWNEQSELATWAAVQIAAHTANTNCKARLVEPLNITEVGLTPTGRMETNGGVYRSSVATGYGGNEPGTSRLGIVWWRDFANRKHVRIVADRYKLKGRKVLSIFGEFSANQPDFAILYTSAYLNDKNVVVIKCNCGFEGEPHVIEFDGETCYSCRSSKAYLEETGFGAAVGKKF